MSETYDPNPNIDAKFDPEFDASTLNLFEETVQHLSYLDDEDEEADYVDY
jgi:hypothetical protein